MDTSFRLRIGSLSIKTSAEFAFAVLPYLQSALEYDLTPLQIMKEPCTMDVPFVDVRNLNWRSAMTLLHELPDRGINTLILSEQFLQWDTLAASINEHLNRFQEILATMNITVIMVEHYTGKQKESMAEKFKTTDNWHEASTSEIFTKMIHGYRAEELCCPYGSLPYFLLEPSQNETTEKTAKYVHALVGFQPWQYEDVLNRWPTPKFPLQHTLTRIKRQPIPQTGAIPIKIRQRCHQLL